MSINRYADLKFRGSPLKRALKRLFWNAMRRPCRRSLGRDTYAMPGFACSAPDRLRIGARGTIGRRLKVNMLLEWFEQRFDPAVHIGDDVYIGSDCEIVSIAGITIGSGVTLSDHVYINDASHSLDPSLGLLMDRPLRTKGPISIGDGCFIGRGAMILSGVTLGAGCIVAAAAVVRESAPPGSVLIGNPASVSRRGERAAEA